MRDPREIRTKSMATLLGTVYADTLFGTSYADTIFGRAGVDQIFGGLDTTSSTAETATIACGERAAMM